MIIYGYIIYVLLAAILWAFWKKVRGQSFQKLIQQSAIEHHQIQELHKNHPHGGTWGEFNEWLAAERANTKPQT